MLTNQMRGRAIRIDRNAPEKIASIWHLVAIEPQQLSGLGDLRDLMRRFDTFVGLSERRLTIESGFERMDVKALTHFHHDQAEWMADASNREMKKRFGRRSTVRDRWRAALTLQESARVVPGVQTNSVPPPPSYLFPYTFGALLFQIVSASVAGMFFVLGMGISHLFTLVSLAAMAAFVWALPHTWRLSRVALKHLPVDGSLKQIGAAVCDALSECGAIKSERKHLTVVTQRMEDRRFHLSLVGGTFHEASLFADTVAEVLAPIDQPRYVITRTARFMGRKRTDYHAVPLTLGVRKESAELFHRAWQKHLGKADLIYTRSATGRAELLKARARAFSAVAAPLVRREDRWQ
jgi:hypothetical protein